MDPRKGHRFDNLPYNDTYIERERERVTYLNSWDLQQVLFRIHELAKSWTCWQRRLVQRGSVDFHGSGDRRPTGVISGLYWGSMGIMEKKMETIIMGYIIGLRV